MPASVSGEIGFIFKKKKGKKKCRLAMLRDNLATSQNFGYSSSGSSAEFNKTPL